MSDRWLSIIGIGEDGRAGLSATALRLVEGADLIIGGRRHLELIGETRGEKAEWEKPLEATATTILARRGSPVAVLASGDPFWFGSQERIDPKYLARNDHTCLQACTWMTLIWGQNFPTGYLPSPC